MWAGFDWNIAFEGFIISEVLVVQGEYAKIYQTSVDWFHDNHIDNVYQW